MSPPRPARATPGRREAPLACGLLCIGAMWVRLTCLVAGLAAAPAWATCNIIPSPDRTFGSTLGTVSAPFARPGDRVVLRREEAVFASAPAENRVLLHFDAPDGTSRMIEAVVLAPAPPT